MSKSYLVFQIFQLVSSVDCKVDNIFENIVTKEEIAQNVQFLLVPQCFPLLVIGYPLNYRDFLFFDKLCSMSSAAELPYEGKG